MTEFDAKSEATLLKHMAEGFDSLSGRYGGDHSAAKLYDDVRREWCKLSQKQSDSTAAELGPALLKDGSGNSVGITTANDSSIYFNCLPK